MHVQIKWHDGVEEIRDISWLDSARDYLVIHRHLAAPATSCVLAGRQLDGTPIYYEDTSLSLVSQGIVQTWGRALLASISLTLLPACTSQASAPASVPDARAAGDLVRYETADVVCYRVLTREGLWCYQKAARSLETGAASGTK